MITLYRRGKVWWACSTFDNHRDRWSLKTRDRDTAEQLRKAAEIDYLSGGRLTAREWKGFETEFTAWITPQVEPSTLRNYRHIAKRFGRFLESRTIAQLEHITPAVISEFSEDRRKDVHPTRKRVISESGIRFDLRALRRIFSYAVECGYLKKNPVIAGNLKSPPGRTLPFSDDEIAAMLNDNRLQSQPRMRALVLLFLYTGLRCGDVRSLRKSEVKDGWLFMETRKCRKMVNIALNAQAIGALDVYQRSQTESERQSPLLFPSPTGGPMNVARVLHRLFTRCGIVGGHPHRFRHTLAVNVLKAGGSLYDVAKLLGITNATAERHYTPYCQELQQRGAMLLRSLNYGVAGVLGSLPN